jgi:hypothetical protein
MILPTYQLSRKGKRKSSQLQREREGGDGVLIKNNMYV